MVLRKFQYPSIVLRHARTRLLGPTFLSPFQPSHLVLLSILPVDDGYNLLRNTLLHDESDLRTISSFEIFFELLID
jgi:hypothetical protein